MFFSSFFIVNFFPQSCRVILEESFFAFVFISLLTRYVIDKFLS